MFALSAFLLLIGRVYHLQILKGAEYKAKSESNFIQEHRIAHSRGLIYDAVGHVLVDNRPSHDVYITFSFLPDSRKSLSPIADILEMDEAERKEIDKKVLTQVGDRNADIIVLAKKISAKSCRVIEELAEKKAIRGIVVARKTMHREDGCDIWVKPMEFPSRAVVFIVCKRY